MRSSCFAFPASLALAAAVAAVACGSTPDQTHTTTSGSSSGGGSTTTTGSAGATGGAGGAAVYPAPHPAAPTIVDQGGPTLTSLSIVPVFFANDDAPTVAELKTFFTEVGPSSYWAAAGKAYGISAPTVLPPIDLAETPTGSIDDADIEAWLAAKLNADDAAFPAATGSTLVTLFYPSGVTVTQGSAKSCGFYGYHGSITLDAAHGGIDVPYAVVIRCGSSLGALTQTASHELFEAATDPYPAVSPAYSQLDDDHVLWELLAGAEVGDLCDISPSFGTFPGIDAPVQRIWSNPEAAASHDPCVPHAAGEVYFAAAPVLADDVVTSILGPAIHTRAAAVDVGASKTIDLALFSDAPTSGPWQVKVLDASEVAGGPAQLSFSLDKKTGTNGDTLHLTIKPLAAGPSGFELFYVLSTLGAQTNAWVGVVSTKVNAASCSTAGSAQACFQCCSGASPGGPTAYQKALDDNCACAAGSPCNAACTAAGSNLCATPPQQASTACFSCLGALTGAEACYPATLTECNADPSCAAYYACALTCPAN